MRLTRAILGLLAFVGFVVVFSAATAQAAPNTCTNPVQAKHSITALRGSASDGVITKLQADDAVTRCLDQLSKAGYPATEAEVLATPEGDIPAPKLSTPQRIVGALTFINIIVGLCALGFVVAFSYFFGAAVRRLLKRWKIVPLAVYEGLFYSLSIATFAATRLFNGSAREWVAAIACGLLTAATVFTIVHWPKLGKWVKTTVGGAVLSLIYFAVYAAAAVYFDSSLIGFFAVGALLTACGFGFAMMPGVYAVGFQDEDSVGKGTLAAFTILIGFVCKRIFGGHIQFLEPFDFGAIVLGSFVGYLGLLIISARWFEGRKMSWGTAQFITAFALVTALAVGSIFDIGALQKVGGTFAILYLLEKFMEVRIQDRLARAAYLTVGFGLICLIGIWFIQHPELIEDYVLFI